MDNQNKFASESLDSIISKDQDYLFNEIGLNISKNNEKKCPPTSDEKLNKRESKQQLKKFRLDDDPLLKNAIMMCINSIFEEWTL